MTRHSVLPAILLALCLFPLPGKAQEDRPEGEGRKRVEDFRRMKLIEALDLTEEQTLRFFAREKDFKNAQHQLMDQRSKIIERLQALSKDGGNDAEIQKEVGNVFAINTEMMQQRKEYILGLKDLLSSKQIAQLLVFEDQFSKQLRRALEDMRHRQPRSDR